MHHGGGPAQDLHLFPTEAKQLYHLLFANSTWNKAHNKYHLENPGWV
jgi:hypothetical protein